MSPRSQGKQAETWADQLRDLEAGLALGLSPDHPTS